MSMTTSLNLRTALPVAILLFGLAACSGESEGPADPAGAGRLPDVTHFLEPTDQMREAAEQQCLDDEELDEGYVKAVSPDTDEILAELSVDCLEFRASK